MSICKHRMGDVETCSICLCSGDLKRQLKAEAEAAAQHPDDDCEGDR